ncbi:MAG TPA: HD-GYP domain-containing protein [Dissulfurispiraceae bacterium]|nr:HD-GYP domain-containing protein [Dissulfurispiraceae bacterium]
MSTRYREIGAGHVSLSIAKLQVGTRLPFDVYIKDGGVVKPLFNKGMIFSRIAHSVLQEKGVSDVYILAESSAAMDSYVAHSALKEGSVLEDPVAFMNYSHTKDKYFQIERGLLVADTVVPFSIYAQERMRFHEVARASDAIPVKIDNSVLQAVGDLCIMSADVPKYHEYIKSLVGGKSQSAEDAARVKTLAVKENAKVIMKELLQDPRSGQAIKKTGQIVNNMIDSILENRDTIYDLVSLKQYDYYTYTHSVNVGVLSVGLGLAVNLDRSQTALLGMGAMLHDVGKSAMPPEILNKQGKLDDTEYMLIKNHVVEGEKILRSNAEFPPEALPAALQHHEKLTGRGYPGGLSGKDIKQFGRIAAIADCYDALTTRRPYKAPMTPFYALSVIAKDTGDYDPELLKIFIRMLGKIK